MQKAIQLFFKILIIGIIVSAVISAWAWGFEALQGRNFVFDVEFGREILGYLLYGVLLTTINLLFFNYLDKDVNWEKHNKLSKYRIPLGFIGGLIITLIGIFLIRFVLVVGFGQKDFQYFITNENPTHYYIVLFISFVISLIFHAFYFYKSIQENKIKEQKIIAGTASAKFESLKNQIDPHFLFNSLNVLSSLIEENPDNAQKFTTSLSKIYRYVLDQKDKELVSVQEELAFAKTYMNLIKMRFENSITFKLPQNYHNDEGKVVPLSLQLLLENCIKHNVASEQNPLYITISVENNFLVIENNLQKKETLDKERKGVGLQNIINRYAILTNRRVETEENGTHFKVKIPILTKQIEIMETVQYNEEKAYVKAKKRVKDIKEFYGNLLSYLLFIPFLIFINYYTSWGFKWFWFPTLGWGMGLIFHGFDVFGYGKNWEERKIEEILSKDKDKGNRWQ
jgi:two-component sensor histidine kinase